MAEADAEVFTDHHQFPQGGDLRAGLAYESLDVGGQGAEIGLHGRIAVFWFCHRVHLPFSVPGILRRMSPNLGAVSKCAMTFKLRLDKYRICGIIIHALAGLCKGSTTDSDSVCEGSNPSPAAIETPGTFRVPGVFFFYYSSLDGSIFLAQRSVYDLHDDDGKQPIGGDGQDDGSGNFDGDDVELA